jgi:serine/threonine protein kinase
VRLIDFGIARVEDSQLASDTATQRSIGTLLYIAPEQLWGNIEQTPAIDIYAFAIVIYEMLTEQLPFKPGSIVEMFELQKEGVKVLPSKLRTDLPVEAEKVLLSALDFEAEKRPQNARAFGRDFVSALLKDTNYETNNELVTSDLETIYPLPLKSGLFTQAATTLPSIGSQETNFPNINFPGAAKKNSNKWLMWGLLGLLLVFALSIPVGIALWNNSGQTPPVNITNTNTVEKTNNSSGSQRELTYFLNVQKMRDGEPFEEPFKSSGQEIFENGYKFKMVFQSDAKGFLYLFNEDKGTQGKTIYHILYPTPKTKNGSAQVSAKEQIETSNNTFSGLRGTELVWLIWTAQIQNDLEAVKQSAFNAKGTIRDEESVKKLADLLQKYSNEKNEISKDTASQQTIIRGNGDVVVNQIHLEHR